MSYSLILTTLFAERATLLESREEPPLDDAAFARDTRSTSYCGAVTTPSTSGVMR